MAQLWEIGQTKGFMIQATSHHIFSQAELAIFRNFSLQQIASPSACWSFEKRACSFWFIWQSANCTFHPRLCLRWVRVWFGKLSTMHFALCTLHYALWNTRALAYDLENCRNFAAIPTPSELGDPSVWERDRPSFSSPTPVESLCPVSLFGAIRKIFSQTPSFSSSHTYKAQFWTDLIFWSTSYPQKITSHTYQGAEFLQIPLFGAPQYVDIF